MNRINDNHIDRITLLFGAGVSIDCGIPSGTELVRQVTKDAPKKLLNFYKAIRKEFKNNNNSEPDFEDVLVFLDMINQSQTKVFLNYVGKNNKTKISDALKNCRELKKYFIEALVKICFSYSIEKAQKQYKSFFELSEKLWIQIFTTNYDTILEEVLNEMGIKTHSTNFLSIIKGTKTVFQWDSSCKSLDKSWIQIAKMHGSITWFKDTQTGVIEDLPGLPSFSSERHPIENVMITPTVFKDVYQPPYYALYDRFNETIKKSKIVIVIGHSLRDEWIYGALRNFVEKENCLVYVAPLQKGLQSQRIKDLCKNDNVIYFNSTCLKFMPLLVSILNQSTEEPTIIQELKNKAKEIEREKIEKKKKKTRAKTLIKKKVSPAIANQVAQTALTQTI